MTLKLVNGGEVLALEYLVNKSQPQDLVLRLFQNDITPSDTNTASSYTESTFVGYAPVTLIGANWSSQEGNPSFIIYPDQVFASSAAQAAQSNFGYFLTRLASGELVWAEKFTSPQVIQNLTDKFAVAPRIEAGDRVELVAE